MDGIVAQYYRDPDTGNFILIPSGGGMSIAEGDARYQLKQDTGWRDMTAQMTNGWTGAAGALLIRRVNGQVWIRLHDITVPASLNGDPLAIPVPSGFQGDAGGYQDIFDMNDYTKNVHFGTFSSVWIRTYATPHVSGHKYRGLVWYPCGDTWPSVLPGTPY